MNSNAITNTLQIDKKYVRKMLKYDTNTIQMRYKYITNRRKVCKKEGEPVKNLSNMFLRLAQYPQIKSSIYKLLGVRYQKEAGKYAKKEKKSRILCYCPFHYLCSESAVTMGDFLALTL